ncbi:hypothetical protein [Dysgonomonas sp. ZJ709]|uniref:hypothetical protein n=1 Tax=Dysgonomonas sp. ZJ709 TaxID=2709797 RepID=UPI0013EA5B04|nr:hypothetical protein [Dysgonomonas sp. ZJ709]
MRKIIVLILLTILAITAHSQSRLQVENSYLSINLHGDISLHNLDRKSGGRALVPYGNNTLLINAGNDFTGGTQIANQAFFKDYGMVLGEQMSTTVFGEVNRLIITPYRHGSGTWVVSSRDIPSAAFLDFNYGVNKGLLTIKHQGNIGIGVADPQNKLEVNGTIRCAEVKIQAVPWSDFVFAKDYELPSLEEVEAHIKEHKHLPDVPSEAQVKEEGINIGEMQAKLLQKIEELTLYVIEQDKTIKEQSKLINKLQERIGD